MLARICDLVEELNRSGIRCCHWKRNGSLCETVSGETDIDLLVHRKDATLFRGILNRQRFRPVRNTGGAPLPSVEHHRAQDSDTGELAHLHAYYRVITGESLAENYRLRIEEMLLENTRMGAQSRCPLGRRSRKQTIGWVGTLQGRAGRLCSAKACPNVRARLWLEAGLQDRYGPAGCQNSAEGQGGYVGSPPRCRDALMAGKISEGGEQ